MKKKALILTHLFSLVCFSQSISDLYKDVAKAVVQIKTIQPEIVTQGEWQTLIPTENLGTGFVISDKGEIITAAHVVQIAEDIIVVFNDGEEVPARVQYSHPIADVALIKLVKPKSTPLYPAKFGNSDSLNIGDRIFVVGAPFGLRHSLSVGYVGGKYKRKDMRSGFITTDFIQTDAAINEGSSGAPLFNMSGEVVGIASFILSRTKFQGLSFAATSNIAQKLLSKEHGIWTGIQSYLVEGHLAEILNVPQNGGVLVQKVAASSLGETMGLQGGCCNIIIAGEEIIVGGDILLTLWDIPLTDEENLIEAWQRLQGLKPGDTIKFKILRKGQIKEFTKIIPKK